MFEHVIEQKILEAQRKGEFDNLPGRGEPQRLDDDSDIPEVSRMAYRILKNAGMVPEEVQLRKELIDLQKLIDEQTSDQPAEQSNGQPDRRRTLLAKFNETEARYQAALERRRRR